MNDDAITKKQLIEEIAQLRERINDLEEKHTQSGNTCEPPPFSLNDTRIIRFHTITEAMKEGHFDSQVRLRGAKDELDNLGQSLNDLSGILEDKFYEIRTLLKVTQQINSGLVLEEVLNSIYESFRPIIPYNRIGFALLDEKGEILRAHWTRSDSQKVKLKPGYSAPMEGSSLQKIIETGQPRIINDLEHYSSGHPQSDSTKLIIREGIRSSLTCPLIALGKPIGFLFFSSAAPNTYKDIHIDIFLQIVGELSVIVEKGRLYQQLLEEQKRSEHLLLNILPPAIAERLKQNEEDIADNFSEATVLFADLVGFTKFSSTISPDELVIFLNQIFQDFDSLVEKHQLEKIKTIGDAYMLVGGLPKPDESHPGKVARMALDMLNSTRKFSTPTGEPLQIRIGIHIGPVVAGIIGKKKFIYDLWGDTVNVASRMESSGLPGKIHVTTDAYNRLKNQFNFTSCEKLKIKGKGKMSTWFLIDEKK